MWQFSMHVCTRHMDRNHWRYHTVDECKNRITRTRRHGSSHGIPCTTEFRMWLCKLQVMFFYICCKLTSNNLNVVTETKSQYYFVDSLGFIKKILSYKYPYDRWIWKKINKNVNMSFLWEMFFCTTSKIPDVLTADLIFPSAIKKKKKKKEMRINFLRVFSSTDYRG